MIFLVEKALGRQNAATDVSIVRYLGRRGLKMSVEHWRQGVLGYIMESVVFVGVCDKGVFLILDEEDVSVAEEFLGARVDTLVRRLAILRYEAETAGLLR